MTSAFSWQNSNSLCPASFCTPRPSLPVIPGVSWLPTFAFQSPIMKTTSFWVLDLEGLVGLHATIQLQLLQHYWLGHRLGLPWFWMVCLGNEQRSFCYSWNCNQLLYFRLLLTMRATLFFLKDSCLQSGRGLSNLFTGSQILAKFSRVRVFFFKFLFLRSTPKMM